MVDNELRPLDWRSGYDPTIIDLAEVRLQAGAASRRATVCEHKNLLHSDSERRVWCNDCHQTIDSFDAFMTLVKHFEKMENAARSKAYRLEKSLADRVISRAAKAFDKAWRGNVVAPACPHCRGGLLPEDFADGATAWCSKDLELARRKRALGDSR